MIRSNLPPPQRSRRLLGPRTLPLRSLALIFTALLVLLVEDDSSDNKLVGDQQSRLTSYRRRFVGLSEKEREWSIRLHSSYYGYSPVQRNVTGSPAPVTVTAQTRRHQRQVIPKRLSGAYPPHLFPIPHLIHAPFDRPSR
jgi:hypothetical protein